MTFWLSMLWLIFHSGNERFAIRSDRVDKVLPNVELHAIAQSPRGLAGVFSYRGNITPVIDLTHWLSGTGNSVRLSNRIILLQTDVSESGQTFGLLVDRVVELRSLERTGTENPSASWSGSSSFSEVISDEQGML